MPRRRSMLCAPLTGLVAASCLFIAANGAVLSPRSPPIHAIVAGKPSLNFLDTLPPTIEAHTADHRLSRTQAYLSYITTHYANLPSVLVFLPSTSFPILHSSSHLWSRLPTDPATPYTPLNCTYLPTTFSPLLASQQHLRESDFPLPRTRDGPVRTIPAALGTAYTSALTQLEGYDYAHLPPRVSAPEGGAFLVGRDAVRARNREAYAALSAWMAGAYGRDSAGGNVNPAERERVGDLLWHVLFGAKPVLAHAATERCGRIVYPGDAVPPSPRQAGQIPLAVTV